MTVASKIKDPNEVLDWPVDWSDGLDPGDTIATSTFIVPTGLTKDSQSNTTTSALVWLSGGTHGTEYIIVNRVTTTQGRTHDKMIIFLVLDH